MGAIAVGDLVKSTLGPKGMVSHVNLLKRAVVSDRFTSWKDVFTFIVYRRPEICEERLQSQTQKKFLITRTFFIKFWIIFSHLSRQDKILLSGGKDGAVTVTNDGATILKAIGVDNPAAKVLVGE